MGRDPLVTRWSLIGHSLVTRVPSRVSSKTLPVYLKDSITTWEVLAVSLSPSKGTGSGRTGGVLGAAECPQTFWGVPET